MNISGIGKKLKTVMLQINFYNIYKYSTNKFGFPVRVVLSRVVHPLPRIIISTIGIWISHSNPVWVGLTWCWAILQKKGIMLPCLRIKLIIWFLYVYVNEIIYYFRAVLNRNLLMDFVEQFTLSIRLPTCT